MALDETINRIKEEIRQAELRGGLGTLSELDARRELIDPVLRELGWRGVSRLRHEYPVESHKRMKMDYALLGSDGKPVAMIEAKAPRENLHKHVEQLFAYAFHQDVSVCALTTGVRWWMYLPSAGGTPEERQFATLNLRFGRVDTLCKRFQEVLGYDALLTGAAAVRAQGLLKKRKDDERLMAEIPRSWSRLLTEPDSKILELIREEVFQAIGQRPSLHEMRKALPDTIVSRNHLFPIRGGPTIGEIVEVVNEVCLFSTRPLGPTNVTKDRARDLMVYLARKHTKSSFVEIASQVGLEEHATVMDAYRRAERQINSTRGDDFASRPIRRWHRAVCKRLGLDT